jgi:hypothetical protein
MTKDSNQGCCRAWTGKQPLSLREDKDEYKTNIGPHPPAPPRTLARFWTGGGPRRCDISRWRKLCPTAFAGVLDKKSQSVIIERNGRFPCQPRRI